MLTVIVQSASGAVHGEDRLLQRFHIGAEAAAHVTTQGASSIYRADAGATSKDAIVIRVEDGGYLEFLPEPRILFPGSALDQTIEIDCAAQGVALVSDAFTVHDPEAKGRIFRRLTSTAILRCDGGSPALIDRMDIGSLGSGKTAAYTAFGSVLLFAPGGVGKVEAFADELSSMLAIIPNLYGAASTLPGRPAGLGVRMAGRDLRAVRAGLHASWIQVRRHLYGAVPPPRRKDEGGPSFALAPMPRTT